MANQEPSGTCKLPALRWSWHVCVFTQRSFGMAWTNRRMSVNPAQTAQKMNKLTAHHWILLFLFSPSLPDTSLPRRDEQNGSVTRLYCSDVSVSPCDPSANLCLTLRISTPRSLEGHISLFFPLILLSSVHTDTKRRAESSLRSSFLCFSHYGGD